MASLPPLQSGTTGTFSQLPSLEHTPSQLLLIFAREAKERSGERRRHVFEEEEEEYDEQEEEEEEVSKEKRRRQKWDRKRTSDQIVTETPREVRIDLDNSDDYDTDLDATEDSSDVTGPCSSSRRMYILVCRKLCIRPVRSICRGLDSDEVVVRGRGLQSRDILGLCNALLENQTVHRLILDNNSLNKKSAIYIAYLLCDNNHISTLSLAENHIGSEGVKAICQILQDTRSLASLDLSGNKIQDKDIREITQSLEINKSLTRLNLSHNEIGDEGAKLLTSAIASNEYLKHLDLSWNNIRPEGGVAIATGLKENVILTTLKLGFNGFADKGSTALAEALEVNEVLLDLDLTCNRIFDTGLARIAKALLVNETLRCLRVSNNPLTTSSAVVLLTVIKSNPFSSLELVDMSKTHIYKDAVELLNDVRQVRPNFYLLYAGTVRSKDAFAVQEVEGISRRNPLSILKEYIDVKGLRLIDLFKQFDKDGSGSVSRVEFIQGLKNMHVPLTEHQLDVLIKTLDTDGDGEVDYGELVTGERAYRKKAWRELKLKKITNQNEAEKRRLELDKFFSSPYTKKSTDTFK